MAKPKPRGERKRKKKTVEKRTGQTRQRGPMTAEQAAGLIFGRLCREQRERGPNAEMDPESLRRELRIPEEVFNEARRALRGPTDDQDLRLAYNVATRKWKLGAAWKARCEEASRKARQPEAREGGRMKEYPTTTERKCPKCRSANVEYKGLAHAPGVGERIAKDKKHQFECGACKAIFWYVAEFP